MKWDYRTFEDHPRLGTAEDQTIFFLNGENLSPEQTTIQKTINKEGEKEITVLFCK